MKLQLIMITNRETKKQEISTPHTHVETHEFEGDEESPYHSHHHTYEIYQIICGTSLITEGKRSYQMTPRDNFILIPPRTPHSIKNVGQNPLIFMSIKSGSFDTEDFYIEPRSFD